MSSPFIRTVPLLAWALIAGAGPALAAWPHDPNNGNVAVCTAALDQRNPTIVSDGTGGAIIAWVDTRSGTDSDIYTQRVNAAGVPQWAADGVPLCAAVNSQQSAAIASDGSGGAIVTWTDGRGVSIDIYAQRVNAAGSPQWAVNGVALCTAVGTQTGARIVSDGAGGAIVTWHDARGVDVDIYAQRVSSTGVPQWTANGVALCTAASTQQNPAITSDGAGGAVVTWEDYRSGTVQIYGQRVNGVGATQWSANGVLLCNAAPGQTKPTIASDGAGGAIVAWMDFRGGGTADIYAQRVSTAGALQWGAGGVPFSVATSGQEDPAIVSDGTGGAIAAWKDFRNGAFTDVYAQRLNAAGTSQWTVDGVPLCTATGGQGNIVIASDGTGGAVVTWEDGRFDALAVDIYAQRVNAAGATQWTSDGLAVSVAPSYQNVPMIASDGSGGAIVVWHDYRSGSTYDIYAQRIESFGYLGSPEPSITGIRDIPNDQGGQVKLSWNASYLDAQPYRLIDTYWILRAAPPNVVAEARARGARVTSDLSVEPAHGERTFFTLPDQATGYAWEFLASQPAFHVPSYSYVAPTTSDSIGAGNPRSAFMIIANHSRAGEYWDSAPDSGYSVDNLPPAVPAPFTGAYVAGATHLHWGRNIEPDLAGYRLYRGASAGFTPGPGNLISAQPDTGFNDVGPLGSYYKLSAIDAHGNSSLFALLGPNGTLDASGDHVAVLYLAPVAPNPMPRTGATIRFGLPRPQRAEIAVFDLAGRRVRVLMDAMLDAGDRQIRFDGRDGDGHALAGGLFFIQLRTPDRTLTDRFVLAP